MAKFRFGGADRTGLKSMSMDVLIFNVEIAKKLLKTVLALQRQRQSGIVTVEENCKIFANKKVLMSIANHRGDTTQQYLLAVHFDGYRGGTVTDLSGEIFGHFVIYFQLNNWPAG